MNLVEKNPRRITKKDRLVCKLNYGGVNFPVSKNDCWRVEIKAYKSKLVYPVYSSNQKFNNSMDLLLISNEWRSHYVYIKDFDRLMFSTTKNKNKKYFCMCCLQCFSSEEILIEHKKDCLSINRKQNVRLKSGKISFKNFHKQISVPFKKYADFESILKKVKNDISGSDSNS